MLPRPLGESTRGQSGFTLLELLVVIAILGTLSGVAVFAMGNLREKAENAALDESLRTVATATQAQVILANATLDQAVGPALDEMVTSHGTNFETVTSSPTRVIMQARPNGKQTPCRQMDLNSQQPVPCLGSAAVSRLILSANLLPDPVEVRWNNSATKRGNWLARFMFQNTGDQEHKIIAKFTLRNANGTSTEKSDTFTIPKKGSRNYIVSSGPGLGTISANRNSAGQVTGIVSVSAEIIKVHSTTGPAIAGAVKGQVSTANHPKF